MRAAAQKAQQRRRDKAGDVREAGSRPAVTVPYAMTGARNRNMVAKDRCFLPWKQVGGRPEAEAPARGRPAGG